MQLRCRGLRQYKTYANKSDGAGVYSTIQQCGSPGQARGGTVEPRLPRCTGSSHYVAGDGKAACDRYSSSMLITTPNHAAS